MFQTFYSLQQFFFKFIAKPSSNHPSSWVKVIFGDFDGPDAGFSQLDDNISTRWVSTKTIIVYGSKYTKNFIFRYQSSQCYFAHNSDRMEIDGFAHLSVLRAISFPGLKNKLLYSLHSLSFFFNYSNLRCIDYWYDVWNNYNINATACLYILL